MNGPRVRRRRARRIGKALVLLVLMAALVLVSSLTARTIPQTREWAKPTLQNLAVARNEYSIAGGPYGNAKILLERFIDYEAYITGEVDDPALCGPVADGNDGRSTVWQAD